MYKFVVDVIVHESRGAMEIGGMSDKDTNWTRWGSRAFAHQTQFKADSERFAKQPDLARGLHDFR